MLNHAAGSYNDTTPGNHETIDNVGLIEWKIETKKFQKGGINCVFNSRNMDSKNDPYIEFHLKYRIPEYSGNKHWKLAYVSGIYKTKRGFWETHVGYPYAGPEVWNKGLCTILYRHMLDYSLLNGIKLVSSEAYATSDDVKSLFNRLEKYYNFKKNGKRLFLRNKK